MLSDTFTVIGSTTSVAVIGANTKRSSSGSRAA